MEKECCRGKCPKKDTLEEIISDHLDAEARIHKELVSYAKERFTPVWNEKWALLSKERYEEIKEQCNGNLINMVGEYFNQFSIVAYSALDAFANVMEKHYNDSVEIHREVYERVKNLYFGEKSKCDCGGECGQRTVVLEELD